MTDILEEQSIQQKFTKLWKFFSYAAWNHAENKGFHRIKDEATGGIRSPSKVELLGLITSEVGEAIEAVRNHNPASKKIENFSLLEEELADIVIRIFDMEGQCRLRVGEAVVAKMKYNLGREFRHGGKAL